MQLGLKRISTALGLVAVAAAGAFAQAPADNQATANAVASALKSSPDLASYRLEIETMNGQVILSGGVVNASQKAQALSIAGRVSGVTAVVDQIKIVGDNRVRPAQYQTAMNNGRMMQMAPSTMAPAQPAMTEGMMVEPGTPLPEGPSGRPGATQAAIPSYPNYSWPSYAPHPNYSAVGYPTAYPWQAWPNISAPYPYPEVPLDWRAVTLRWNDGIWWLDFKKHYTRPFFIPYPFGIGAY
jgi:hypothetical protein